MAYQGERKPYKSNKAPAEQVIVEGILKALWAVASFPFKKRSGGKGGSAKADLAKFRTLWEEVEWYAEQPNYSHQAIMEADKLFGIGLEYMRLPGMNLGERLKAASGHFDQQTYQSLWEAHKLRNRLAHEAGVVVSQREAVWVVQVYREALKQQSILPH